MTQNQIRIQFLIRKLRYRQKDSGKNSDILNRIIWHSLPVVYPNCYDDMKELSAEIELRKKRVYRAKRFIQGMQDSYSELFFATLTFSDDVLQSTSESTRHTYAKRFFADHCRAYFANQDHGEKNGREHYHAVIAINRTETLETLSAGWKYGFSNFKPVRHGKKDSARLGKYLNKLSAHANKLGTGKQFHSRNKAGSGNVSIIGRNTFSDIDILPF